MFERVASVSQLEEAGDRLHLAVKGRYVTILRYDGKLFCVDSTCYHAGGPLGLGDIEELNGEICLTCPWHHYKIALVDGSKLYEALELNKEKKLVPSGWKRKPHAQRIHRVETSGSDIFVELSDEGKYDSDEYDNVIHSQGDRFEASAGRDGKLTDIQMRNQDTPVRSGHVLNPPNKDNGTDYHTVHVSTTEKVGAAGLRLKLSLANTSLLDKLKSLRVDPNIATPEHAFNTFNIRVRMMSKTGFIVRPYTPICATIAYSMEEDVELNVRTYPNGIMSQHLSSLYTGNSLPIMLENKANDGFLHKATWESVQLVVLIAGGSGITPMLQIAQNVLNSDKAKTNIHIICANDNANRILCLKHLTALAKAHWNRITVTHLLRKRSQEALESIMDNQKIVINQPIQDLILNMDLEYSIENVVFACCGPQGFLDNIRDSLEEREAKWVKEYDA